MTTLYQKYRQEIEQWDWDEIIASAQANVQEGDFMHDEDSYGSYFLGSILSLSPSGKYYTPWANGNVDACPQCHGQGHTQKFYPCKYCDHGERILGEICQATGENPIECRNRLIASGVEFISETIFKCSSCGGTGQVHRDCQRCGGLGSYEAYQDQEYWQALEDVASKHGGWIESGEGDPLDTFFCVNVEQEESEDDEPETETAD